MPINKIRFQLIKTSIHQQYRKVQDTLFNNLQSRRCSNTAIRHRFPGMKFKLSIRKDSNKPLLPRNAISQLARTSKEAKEAGSPNSIESTKSKARIRCQKSQISSVTKSPAISLQVLPKARRHSPIPTCLKMRTKRSESLNSARSMPSSRVISSKRSSLPWKSFVDNFWSRTDSISHSITCGDTTPSRSSTYLAGKTSTMGSRFQSNRSTSSSTL